MSGNDLRVEVLGCGTSVGVPIIGCECGVCTGGDPRNQRLRSSILMRWDEVAVLVDTTPDLRHQALRSGIKRLDAVLWTHPHADHFFGFDDLRPFGFDRATPLPGFGTRETLDRVREAFAYAFAGRGEGGRLPQVALHEVRGPFDFCGRRLVPVPLRHGSMEVMGWRLGDFAYCTDCNAIPDSSLPLLEGLDVLILDALRQRPHPTHFSIDEAVAMARRIGARKTYLTHMTHDVDYRSTSATLPDGVELAWDGLEITVG